MTIRHHYIVQVQLYNGIFHVLKFQKKSFAIFNYYIIVSQCCRLASTLPYKQPSALSGLATCMRGAGFTALHRQFTPILN